MLPWTFAVLIGALGAMLWPAAPVLCAVGGLLGLALAVRWPAARWPVALAAATAFWATLCAAHALSSRLESARAGELVGCVTSALWLDHGRVRFALSATRFDGRAVRWRVQLSGYDGWVAPRPGECWRFVARLRPPRGLLNFHGVDAERRALVNGWSARGTVRLDASAVRLRAVRGHRLLRLRLDLANRIRFVAGEGRAWPLLVALAVGLREPLPPALSDVLVASGTRHLVSISGLHIGLAAALGFLLSRALIAPVARALAPHAWLRARGDRRAGPVCALLVAFAYAALAGFALPTQRALLMLLVFVLATLGRRQLPLPTVLMIAAVALLLRRPLTVLDPGFYLSVGAVAALCSLRLRHDSGLWRAQWIAFVGLWPIVSLCLGRVSLIGPLANAVWVPLFSLVLVPAALFGALVSTAPVAVAWPYLQLLAQLVDQALAWLVPLAALPFAQVLLPQATALALALAAVGAALLLLPAQRLRVRALAVALCLPLAVARADRPAYGQLEVVVMDVSHGLAVALHTRHHTVLYDTGGQWSSTDAGARVVVPELIAHGTRALHSVVLSHGDLDHSGGAASVLAAMPVGAIYAGEPQRGGLGRPCAAGTRWRLDGVTFEFVHPQPHPQARWRGNNASCVLRVTARHGSVLLTGDLERLGEVSLVHHERVRRESAVIGQHHGSRTSSSQRFVALTQPELVVFSTAWGNRWSLPAASVTERWRSVGAKTCATGAAGAVRWRIDGRPIEASLVVARQARPALWRWSTELSMSGWLGAFRVRTGRDILRASC